MPWVITSRFNQECAEEDFGRQRSLGGRNDNPTIHQLGYQANTLRLQRSVVVPTVRLHCVCNGLWWYQQFGYTAYATVCGGNTSSVTLCMQRSMMVPTVRLHCVCNGLWWYQQFGYTAYATVCGGTNSYVTLHMQRSVVVPRGNTRFAHNTKRQFSWFNVDETPLQKRATGFQLQ